MHRAVAGTQSRHLGKLMPWKQVDLKSIYVLFKKDFNKYFFVFKNLRHLDDRKNNLLSCSVFNDDNFSDLFHFQLPGISSVY